MVRPDAKLEKVYLYRKPVGFRKSIDGSAALVELDIKVAVSDPVLIVFLNKPLTPGEIKSVEQLKSFPAEAGPTVGVVATRASFTRRCWWDWL